MIDVKKTRIYKLRSYLFDILNGLVDSKNYQINADMLSLEANNYSLDKIPTSSTVEKWITGVEIHRDTYAFRSRCNYSQDAIDNLTNIGFFEVFEEIIKCNNKDGILPDIDGIESIECLNCGTLNNANTKMAEFEIQIQIKYKKVFRRDS